MGSLIIIYTVKLIWIIITNQAPAIKAINFAPITGSLSILNLITVSLETILLSPT